MRRGGGDKDSSGHKTGKNWPFGRPVRNETKVMHGACMHYYNMP